MTTTTCCKAAPATTPLYGDSGNDTLLGGAGNDQLSESEGADTFVFGRGSAIDRVSVGVRADTATHRIELSGLNAVDVDMQRDGADLVINVRGSTDTLQVTGYFEGEGAPNEVISPKNET
jgi:Ca2+-binding RTX toxin-like protein